MKSLSIWVPLNNVSEITLAKEYKPEEDNPDELRNSPYDN